MIIKMSDYVRIYQIINTILLNEKVDVTGACTFFSHYGANILSHHYKVDAQPVSGLCMYHLGEKDNILTFAEIKDELFVSSNEAFHSWVLVDGWLIDFMAPTFPRLLKNFGQKFTCKPKMMQKPVASMAQSVNDLKSEGDFYFEVDPQVTQNRLEYVSSRRAYSDLAEICINWYRKPPKKMQKHIQIADEKGIINQVSLTGKSVVGAW